MNLYNNEHYNDYNTFNYDDYLHLGYIFHSHEPQTAKR